MKPSIINKFFVTIIALSCLIYASNIQAGTNEQVSQLQQLEASTSIKKSINKSATIAMSHLKKNLISLTLGTIGFCIIGAQYKINRDKETKLRKLEDNEKKLKALAKLPDALKQAFITKFQEKITYHAQQLHMDINKKDVILKAIKEELRFLNSKLDLNNPDFDVLISIKALEKIKNDLQENKPTTQNLEPITTEEIKPSNSENTIPAQEPKEEIKTSSKKNKNKKSNKK